MSTHRSSPRRGRAVAAVCGVALCATVVAAATSRAADAPSAPSDPTVRAVPMALPDEGRLPSLAGATGWFNSSPLTAADLRGKVVLVDFWTYGCSNCQAAVPHVRALAERYPALVVIGVHTPEFGAERVPDNVQQAVRALHLAYPIALDNDNAVWNAFGNHYWPALYLVDAHGRIRYHHFGEGEYAQEEAVVQQLLAEARRTGPTPGAGTSPDSGR